MGNNIASLTQFYSPPNPPTPLSPESYFYIKSTTNGERGGGTTKNENNGDSSSFVRDIPVVYITRPDKKDNSNTTSDNEEQEQQRTTTLLYCHGHDVDLGMIHDFLIHLSKFLNVNVLSFDYAGYGLIKTKKLLGGDAVRRDDDDADTDRVSTSSNNEDQQVAVAGNHVESQQHDQQRSLPTEEECYNDILACFNYLVDEKGVPPPNIILYGKSLGSGPVCWLAQKLCHEATMTLAMQQKKQEQEDDVDNGKVVTTMATTPPPMGGIVLHSAFLSILRLKVGFTVGSILGDSFDNVARLQDMHRPSSSSSSSPSSIVDAKVGYKVPIYFIHGKEDEVVPFNHGGVLYDLVMEKRKKGFPPFWANGGTHWDIEHKYATAYIKRLQQFLRHCDKVNTNGATDTSKDKRSRGRRMAARSKSRTNSRQAASRSTSRTKSSRQPASRSTSRTKSRRDIGHGGEIVQQQGEAMNSNRNTSRGRSKGRTRPSNTTTMHHRSRSCSKARQRKKKGTLVMRGGHDDDDDDDEALTKSSSVHRKKKSNPRNQHDKNLNKSKARVVRESRNPPLSMDRV